MDWRVRGAVRKRDKSKWEEMRETNTLTGQLEGGKQPKIKEEIMARACCKQPTTSAGNRPGKEVWGWLHYLVSGKHQPQSL